MPGKFETPRQPQKRRSQTPQNTNPPRNPRRRRRARRTSRLPFILIPILLIMLIVGGILLFSGDNQEDTKLSANTNLSDITSSPAEENETTLPEATTLPKPQIISTATISAQGDILMHKPVIQTGAQKDGSYDFSSIFRYLKDYLVTYDYAVANLETTLGGKKYPYQGNPEFNCPDEIAAAAKDAGFDMLLTANNHSSDTYTEGMFRTLEQVRSAGLETLGTMLNNDEPKYSIVDINGIKVGMLCYTYADNVTNDGRPSLNSREFVKEVGIINYFTVNNLDKFYSEVQTHLANMEAAGAEATVLYIHWGKEYVLEANETQQAIAQKMCNLGIDAIIGGHPHVVQPVALLQSQIDPQHKTVCIYSLGNAVSNQMKDQDEDFASGHSEDGALFTVTFEKYDDGSVYLAEVNVLPTWVNRNTNSGSKEYNILPLEKEKESQWTEMYGLTGEQFVSAQGSYQRTMEIVGAGLIQAQLSLSQAKAEREG